MARAPRQISKTGYYHVMLRGCGRQILFEDDSDREHFLSCLEDGLTVGHLACIAWCLMDNHVHLLLFDESDGLSRALHVVATSYARYFNAKAGRVGPVFQDRFRSVPVEDERQLLAAVLYIHNNPFKAGIAPVEQYPWSSHREYIGTARYIDPAAVLDLVGGAEGFIELTAQNQENAYFFKPGVRIPDDEMLEAARVALHGVDPRTLPSADVSKRNEGLRVLRTAGLSIRQIERLTGIGRNTISRATSASEWGRGRFAQGKRGRGHSARDAHETKRGASPMAQGELYLA